jgi:hypothetical protein
MFFHGASSFRNGHEKKNCEEGKFARVIHDMQCIRRPSLPRRDKGTELRNVGLSKLHAAARFKMTDETRITGIAVHGASRLPSVDIDSFNIELKDDEGFLGDRASKGAFRNILEKWRRPLRKTGEDPFGKESSESISKTMLDAILVGDDVEVSAVVHSACFPSAPLRQTEGLHEGGFLVHRSRKERR